MLCVALQACIRNDIPYPVVELSITSVEGEGFTCKESDINAEERTAVIHLDETTDISKVMISGIGMTESAVSDVAFPGTFDMRSDLHVILELYQQYEWTISAEQEISRVFKVEGQVGTAEIDPEGRTAKAKVIKTTDLSSLEILELKLGPEGITTMDINAGDVVSFETFRTVTVQYHDFPPETWYLYVEHTDVLANIGSVAAGSKVMWLSGSGVPGTDLGFRYRKAGESEWTDVPDTDISAVSESEIEACVGGLSPETEYEVQAYSGEDVSGIVNVTTGSEEQLPNMDFDDWYQAGSVWYPNLDPTVKVWDSANKGSSIAGKIPTCPEYSDVAVAGEGKCAAKLKTETAFGMLAAGNIYTGEFLGLAGVGASLNWGVPFTSRPTALKGWYKYQPEPVNKADEAHSSLIGSLDICQIQILLTAWEKPFNVNTQTGSFVNFDNDPDIIAYGKFEPSVDADMAEYKDFLIPLEYRDLARTPTYIVITACASKYGDYFTGGEGSVLLVDEFSLYYDKVEAGNPNTSILP